MQLPEGFVRADEQRLKRLLIQGLDGDQSAYRQFLSELSISLRRYVQQQLARLGRGDSEAEDVVQEALLAIHTKRHTYDRETPVTAWSYAITRYKLIDALRLHRIAAEQLSLDDILEGSDDADMRTEAVLSIRKAVAVLPDRLRTSIEFMKFEGLSVAETAMRTGMSEAAVKVNVHRGLKTIARLLG
jgi:RNA polymerase sigma-70 factor (ECF subfamily)